MGLGKNVATLIAAVALGALATTGPAMATSTHTDLTDIWWNPNESGWGLQMVNTGTFVFATIYVYGADGKPTWFTGELSLVNTPGITYSGPLYATNGPYFGGAWNSGAFAYRQAGTMTFVATDSISGTLNYSVDGVAVTKSVQRQPLTLDSYNGHFYTLLRMTQSGCTNSALNGTTFQVLATTITQVGSAMSLTQVDNSGVSCTSTGTFSQFGRTGFYNTDTSGYRCSNNDAGTIALGDMHVDPARFTARISMVSSVSGCKGSGVIGAVSAD
jgi:hypothetical protein